MMQRWDSHWFGPVATIRVYLFQKCFLLVIACDLLVLMVERGARYGIDTIPFNVPHFPWLDAFHRLFLPEGIPTATYYVAVLVTTSFLAFCQVLTAHRRWLMGMTTLFYTYAWSMSRLDSYLHHYMLSIILGCITFLPVVDPTTFVPSQNEQSKKTPFTQITTLALVFWSLALLYRLMLSNFLGLADLHRWIAMFVFAAIVVLIVYRHRNMSSQSIGPSTSSWALRLLATTVGVIYVFTSVAKMDMEWCGGHTLREVGATEFVLQPVQEIFARLGIQKEQFWAGLATFVIPLELTLASIYLVSVRQDEPGRGWLRTTCFVGWMLALGLHLNNEMMNLIIQWFGYYMLLLATLLLLPAKFLLVLGSAFYAPAIIFRQRWLQWSTSLSNGQSAAATAVFSGAAALLLLLFGFVTWIAGAIIAGIVLASVFVTLVVLGIISGRGEIVMRWAAVSTVAAILMIAAVVQSSMRFDYYDLRGKTLQQLGNDYEAAREMELAVLLPPPSPQAAAEVHTNLALAYRRLNDPRKAERNYRRAIALDPIQFLAHYSLANMLVSQQRTPQAEEHYRRALVIKPDFSDAHVNLGNLLEFQGRTKEAIQCYETALSIEENADDIQQMLEAAQAKLAETR